MEKEKVLKHMTIESHPSVTTATSNWTKVVASLNRTEKSNGIMPIAKLLVSSSTGDISIPRFVELDVDTANRLSTNPQSRYLNYY
jgi:hypothetical protein